MKLNLNPKVIAYGIVGAMAIASGAYLIAADHIDAPAVSGTSSDITDMYAFASPANAENMVFVINTQGLLAPGSTAAATFDADVMLQVKIDNSTTKDAVEDLVIQVTFENGKVQAYGPVAPAETGLNSRLVTTANKVESAISTYGAAAVTATANGVTLFAGPRDDPFFFDLDQYHKVIAGTATSFNKPGTDTFAGLNVMSVVVEVPKSTLGTGPVNVWATSSRKK